MYIDLGRPVDTFAIAGDRANIVLHLLGIMAKYCAHYKVFAHLMSCYVIESTACDKFKLLPL